MRLLYGILLLMLFVTSPVIGQELKVTVDNSSMDSADISEVTLTPEGELIIRSKDSNWELKEIAVAPGNVLINSFTINYKASEDLASGVEATLRWSVSNATQGCVASTSSQNGGSVDDWSSATVIAVPSGSQAVVFPSGGVYNLRLDCAGDNASSDSAEVSATVDAAKITKFEVTPASAEKGADVTFQLTWESENTGLGCSGSGNWPNSVGLASSGTDQVLITNLQPGEAFTLRCYSDFNHEVEKTVSIDVITPQLACNTTLTSKVEKEWTEMFREQFPGPRSDEAHVTVPIRGYYSIEFNAGYQDDSGFFGNFEASGTFGYRLGAISKCPGDFNVADECQFSWAGGTGGIKWTTEGLDNKCKLEKGETYYWNMTFTDGVDPDSSRCLGSYCETYFLVSNR